jgi:hypothetical protein
MSALSKILRDTTDNGLMFMCPGCEITHHIRHGNGDGPRWQWNGNAEKPTFMPSILVRYSHWVPKATPDNPDPGPQTKVDAVCHSFVTDGRIQFLGDCTHELAGQTVDLPEWTE